MRFRVYLTEIDYVVIDCVRLFETLVCEDSLRVKVLVTLVAVTFSTEIEVLASSFVSYSSAEK